MNVFKNKKVEKIKKTLKPLKSALNKNRKNVFTSMIQTNAHIVKHFTPSDTYVTLGVIRQPPQQSSAPPPNA